MQPMTLEDFHNDPEIHRRLLEAAHRERARMMRAGLVWLRERLTPRSHVLPVRWIGRLG